MAFVSGAGGAGGGLVQRVRPRRVLPGSYGRTLGTYEGGLPSPSGVPGTIPSGLPDNTPSGTPPGQTTPGTTGSSIFDRVKGIIDPQLSAAAETINRRSQMGSQAISGLTNSLVGMAGQYGAQVGQAYDPAISGAKGVAEWAQQSLVDAGKSGQKDLNAALAQSGVAGPGDINPAQIGKTAGAAAYGTGIADLDRYIAEKAASQTRAALEPGFAAGMGQYQQGLLSAQLARQLSEQQSAIQARVPELLDMFQQRDIETARDARDFAERKREFDVGRTDDATAAALAQKNWERTFAQSERAATRTARADRVSTFLTMQKAREDATGFQWEVTSTGIRPKLVNGRRVPTSTERQQQIENIVALNSDDTGKITATGAAQLKALGVTVAPGTVVNPKLVPKTATPKALQKVSGYTNVTTFDPNSGYMYDAKGNRVYNPIRAATKAAAPKLDVTRSQIARKWVDSAGNPIPELNKPGVKPPPPYTKYKPTTPKGGVKPPTEGQLSGMIQKWYQGAVSRSTSVNSKTGSTTTTTTQTADPITYQQALRKVNAMFADPQARAHAVELLDTTWKRGQYGRPWLNFNTRRALAKAGLRNTVRYAGINFKDGKPTKRIPYLVEAQVRALKAAGLLPPGDWAQHPGYAQGPVYVIASSY